MGGKEYVGPIYEQIDEAYQFVLKNIRVGAGFQSRNRGIVNALTYMKIIEQ